MNFKRSGLIVAAVAVAFGFVAKAADDDHDTPHPATMPSRRRREMGLHQQMETMGRLYKKLKSQIADSSQNASSLDLVSQMEQATLACKSQIPPKVMRMPTTQQAQAKTDYRQMMVTLFRHELDLEEQLVNGDNTKAAQTVAQMDQTEKDGHKEFRGGRRD